MVGGANPLTEKTYEIYSNTRNRLRRFRWVSCHVMKILIGRGRSHHPPWVGTGSEALTQATGVFTLVLLAPRHVHGTPKQAAERGVLRNIGWPGE